MKLDIRVRKVSLLLFIGERKEILDELLEWLTFSERFSFWTQSYETIWHDRSEVKITAKCPCCDSYMQFCIISCTLWHSKYSYMHLPSSQHATFWFLSGEVAYTWILVTYPKTGKHWTPGVTLSFFFFYLWCPLVVEWIDLGWFYHLWVKAEGL